MSANQPAVFHNQNCWQAFHAQLDRQFAMLVNIDLDDRSFQLACRGFHPGENLTLFTTGGAPVCIEVDQHSSGSIVDKLDNVVVRTKRCLLYTSDAADE